MVLKLEVVVWVWKRGGVISPKSSIDGGRHLAHNWGYHQRNFCLFIHKSFHFWKFITLESVLISYFCTLLDITIFHRDPTIHHEHPIPKSWGSRLPHPQDWRLCMHEPQRTNKANKIGKQAKNERKDSKGIYGEAWHCLPTNKAHLYRKTTRDKSDIGQKRERPANWGGNTTEGKINTMGNRREQRGGWGIDL